MLWNHDEKFIRMAGMGVPLWGVGRAVFSQAALTGDVMIDRKWGAFKSLHQLADWGRALRQRKVKAGAQQGRRGQCGPMKAVEARLVGFSKNHRIEYDFYFR